MKKDNINAYKQIDVVSDTEKREMQNYIDKYNKKLNKNNNTATKIKQSVKYIICAPLAIAANMVSVVFKIGGSIAAIGIPYGVYCAYKTISQLYAGIALADIKQTTFVCLFIIFPFTAFALSLLFQKLSEYLTSISY